MKTLEEAIEAFRAVTPVDVEREKALMLTWLEESRYGFLLANDENDRTGPLPLGLRLGIEMMDGSIDTAGRPQPDKLRRLVSDLGYCTEDFWNALHTGPQFTSLPADAQITRMQEILGQIQEVLGVKPVLDDGEELRTNKPREPE